MDLTTLDLASASSEGVKMELYHPITEVSFDPPVYFTVVGIDSDIYQKANRELVNKRLKKNIAKGRIRLNVTAEEVEQEQVELTAKCILGWKNVEWEGKPLPYSYENAKKLLSVSWVREQIDTWIGDRANFLQT